MATAITSTPIITTSQTTILTVTIMMIAEPPTPSSSRLAFLRLLQLASPALPIGAFAYSQGLEPAVTAGWVRDEATAAAWIVGLLAGPLGHQDLPLFARIYRAYAAGDVDQASRWSAFLWASRPTSELQSEDQHLARALGRVLATLALPVTAEPPLTFAGELARATVHHGIDVHTALETFAFMWAEAQTSAAVRLVPLGQSAGVRILAGAAAAIPAAVDRALALADEEIGGAAPGLALLSAAHETQYSRLFRS